MADQIPALFRPSRVPPGGRTSITDAFGSGIAGVEAGTCCIPLRMVFSLNTG